MAFKKVPFTSIIALSIALSAHPALASVRVFQLKQPPTILKSPPQIPQILSRVFGLFGNAPKRSEEQIVYEFIADNKLTFGMENPGDQKLSLKKIRQTSRGKTLRFTQIEKGIPVSGAELIAVFDANGELEAVNSSLISLSSPPGAAEITREEAFAIASRELGYENAELGEGSKDGLQIVNTADGATLVWQFSVREGADASRPMQVQVFAAGAKKGEIFSKISLESGISGDIVIYDASVTLIIPNPIYKGLKVLKNGKRRWAGLLKKPAEAKLAHASLQKASDYYLSTFGRDSFDGNGASLIASVNVGRKFSRLLDPFGMRQNAAWMGPWKMFIFGAGGSMLGNFTKALDVVAHEYTHAVVGSTADLTYAGQPGALNEHLADLFGAAAERHFEPSANPFIIGEKCLRGELKKSGAPGLRDMLDPHNSLNAERALGRPNAPEFAQPAHMAEIPREMGPDCVSNEGNDNCGVHLLNGVPNRALSLAILESGWESIMDLAYRVLTNRLLASSDFENYRDQLLDECQASMPNDTCEAIAQGFESVGL